MMPTGLSNSNRVKSIKSRFEVLNDQSKYGETDLKLQNTTTVPLNLKKVNVAKENAVHKPQTYKHNTDSSISEHSSHNLFENSHNSFKEHLGASSNFGNRKRLKEDNFMNDSVRNESHIDSKTDAASQDVRCSSANDNIFYDDAKENFSFGGSQKSLSRHHSDPIKKLHRSPAFRCDRNEKIKDSRKNSFNSDCSDTAMQNMETDRFRLSRDKLKKLGFLLEEKMKQDNFEFSKPKNKSSGFKLKDFENDSCFNKILIQNTALDNSNQSTSNGVSEKSLQNIKEQLKPIVYSAVLKNDKINGANIISNDSSDIHEAISDDLQIPKHILDQYAQVIKPKNRNAFMRKTPAVKTDVVLSDSGVSSESENLISDDLDDSETSPKLKNFKAIRNNFEAKNIQARDDIPNRRKFLKRSSEDKKIAENLISNNSSKENLIDNDLLNNGENSNESSFDNTTFVDKKNDKTKQSASDISDITVDTLKRVLKQPLPPGPPPKKPPRTFAVVQPNSPTKNIESNDEQVNSKNKENKSKYKNRSKEESKIMLDKIESALQRRENSGKILSPRFPRKENHSHNETSPTDSWSRQGTKPSTAKLKKSHKKTDAFNSSSDSQPKELHYMCTEIFDLNSSEADNILNSSNASINSAESFQTTNSFTKCFNSLNCTNNTLKHSSGMNYTKLDTSPNSTKSSLNNVCCSCNFNSPKDKSTRSSRNSMEEFSPPTQMRRLSTFLPSPSKSIENLAVSCTKCETCGNNPTDQFVCHINNTSNISNRSFSPHEFGDESKSIFYVDRKYDTKQESSSHYGVLKKCKSQEHIYAEPLELKKMNEKLIPKSKSSANVPMFSNNLSKPPLVRMRTQLEDGFGKFREVDSTKIMSLDSNLKTFAVPSNKKQNGDFPDTSSKKLDNKLVLDTGDVAFGGDSSNDIAVSNKSSKVKDILMRLEGGRGSLRIENYKRTDDIRKSLAARSAAYSNKTISFSKNSEREVIPAVPTRPVKEVQSNSHYYSSTKIYDTPESDDSTCVGNEPDTMDQHNAQQPLSVNSSFLYGLEQTKQSTQKHGIKSDRRNSKELAENVDVFKRPPLYERKPTTLQNSNVKSKRPHSLYLTDGESNKKTSNMTFTETRRRRSPTEVDKEHLSRLMTEIYDTVAEACILEGNAAAPSSGDSEHDTSDDVSLKLTRSLTEKRKRYVRRVTSRVGFHSEDNTQIQRQKSVDDKCCDDILDNESDNSFKAYSTFPSRQNIKNASFLHSNINRENKMSDNVASGRTVKDETAKQDTSKEIITKGRGLFEACILVGMNFSTGQAYIKSIYPEMVVVPPQIESLVFPESVASNVSNEPNHQNARPMRIRDEASNIQCYAIVLTNEKGLRTYGYCRRVLPEGATHCLALSYCIIARHRAPSFYYKILQEIESHHGSSENVVNSVLNQLYSSEFPKPGFSVTITQVRSPKRLVVTDTSFKKCSPFRNSVNLGDVLKSESCEGINGSNSSSQSLLVDKDGDKFRRKSSGVSANFPELKHNDLSVMKSLEKIYGENLREFKSNLVGRSDNNEGTSHTNSIDRDLESRSSNLNLKSSCDNSTENVQSESSERYRNDNSSQDTDNEDLMIREHRSSLRNSGMDLLQIKRPLEPRLDEDNLSVLFDSISVSNLVNIFGTLIIERKVVIVCDKLSKLSACIEALQSILYPLTWQHTLVSSIPRDMTRDILEAPIPILAGLLLPITTGTGKHPHPELEKINFDEGMLIDISNNEEKIIKMQKDESTLLPPLLAKTLKASLQLGPPITASASPSDEHAKKTRNVLVAEAFLRFFVEVLGDCKKYFDESAGSTSPTGGSKGRFRFEKEEYIKSFRSKHVQLFLEWFTETAMFNTYIQQRMLLMSTDQASFLGKPESVNSSLMDLPYPDFYEMFDERVSRKGTSQSARAQLSNAGKETVSKGNYKMIVNKKVKVWRDKLRDLVS